MSGLYYLLMRRFSTTLTSSVKDNSINKASVKRHSGAQREVLALYRAWMRAIRDKPVSVERRQDMIRHVRNEFKLHATGVRQLDIDRIDKLMNRGRKQLRHFKLSSGGFEINTVV